MAANPRIAGTRPRAVLRAQRGLSVVRGRHGVRRRIRRPGRRQHRPARHASARGRIRRASRRGKLGRRRLCAGLRRRPAGVRAARRDWRAQDALSLWLCPVRPVLRLVRPCSEPAAPDRVPGPAGDRRLDARGEQRCHPGRGGRRGKARKGARNHGGGAGGRPQPRPDARRRAAGDMGLALDLLGHRAVRPRRRGSRLADRTEDDGHRQRPPVRRRRRGAPDPGPGCAPDDDRPMARLGTSRRC